LRTIILAAVLAAMAAPAFADSAWTASPAQPASASDLSAGDVLWDCDKTGCHTVSDLTGANPMLACWGLVRNFGPLTAFTGFQPFSDDQLAKCNKVATKSGH
jgi:hypothetical protein